MSDEMKKVSIDEKIFDFAYGMAMRDATLQKAYYEPDKTIDKKALLACADAKDAVKKYINGIIGRSEENNKNELGKAADFYSTVTAVESAFREYTQKNMYPEFTFGNIQKLINMTAKSMFFACYRNEEKYHYFKDCHCPMDSIMVEIIIKNVDTYHIDETVEKWAAEAMDNDGVHMSWKAYLRQPWSRIESNRRAQYELFQKIVKSLADKEGVFPLAYDYIHWSSDE